LFRLQPKVKLLINGEFKDSSTDKWINVTNPVGGLTLQQQQHASPEQSLALRDCGACICFNLI
jgi:hypothetical protein